MEILEQTYLCKAADAAEQDEGKHGGHIAMPEAHGTREGVFL